MDARRGRRLHQPAQPAQALLRGEGADADAQGAAAGVDHAAQGCQPLEDQFRPGEHGFLPIVEGNADGRGVGQQGGTHVVAVEVAAVGDDGDVAEALLAGQGQGAGEERRYRRLAPGQQQPRDIAAQGGEQAFHERFRKLPVLAGAGAGAVAAGPAAAAGQVEFQGDGVYRFPAQVSHQPLPVSGDLVTRGDFSFPGGGQTGGSFHVGHHPMRMNFPRPCTTRRNCASRLPVRCRESSRAAVRLCRGRRAAGGCRRRARRGAGRAALCR